tara:strand:- start:11702 stop:14398 length:2697 start_codon:yes stop_codon:yes gene_type:complete
MTDIYTDFDLDSIHDKLHNGGKWGGSRYSSEDTAIDTLESKYKEKIDFFYISKSDISIIKKNKNKFLFTLNDSDLETRGVNEDIRNVNIWYQSGDKLMSTPFFKFFNGTESSKLVDVHDNFFISNFKHPTTLSSLFDSSTSYHHISELSSLESEDTDYLHQSYFENQSNSLDVESFWTQLLDHIKQRYIQNEHIFNFLKKFKFRFKGKHMLFRIDDTDSWIKFSISRIALAIQINQLFEWYIRTDEDDDPPARPFDGTPQKDCTQCVKYIIKKFKVNPDNVNNAIIILRLLKFMGDEAHIFLCTKYKTYESESFNAFMGSNDRMAISRCITQGCQCVFPDLVSLYETDKYQMFLDKLTNKGINTEDEDNSGKIYGIYKNTSILEVIKSMIIYIKSTTKPDFFTTDDKNELTNIFKKSVNDDTNFSTIKTHSDTLDSSDYMDRFKGTDFYKRYRAKVIENKMTNYESRFVNSSILDISKQLSLKMGPYNGTNKKYKDQALYNLKKFNHESHLLKFLKEYGHIFSFKHRYNGSSRRKMCIFENPIYTDGEWNNSSSKLNKSKQKFYLSKNIIEINKELLDIIQYLELITEKINLDTQDDIPSITNTDIVAIMDMFKEKIEFLKIMKNEPTSVYYEDSLDGLEGDTKKDKFYILQFDSLYIILERLVGVAEKLHNKLPTKVGGGDDIETTHPVTQNETQEATQNETLEAILENGDEDGDENGDDMSTGEDRNGDEDVDEDRDEHELDYSLFKDQLEIISDNLYFELNNEIIDDTYYYISLIHRKKITDYFYNISKIFINYELEPYSIDEIEYQKFLETFKSNRVPGDGPVGENIVDEPYRTPSTPIARGKSGPPGTPLGDLPGGVPGGPPVTPLPGIKRARVDGGTPRMQRGGKTKYKGKK